MRKARIINSEGSHSYSIGEIVTLSHDDGSDMPQFCNESRVHQYVKLSEVKFLDEEEIKLSEVSTAELMAEIARRIEGGR